MSIRFDIPEWLRWFPLNTLVSSSNPAVGTPGWSAGRLDALHVSVPAGVGRPDALQISVLAGACGTGALQVQCRPVPAALVHSRSRCLRHLLHSRSQCRPVPAALVPSGHQCPLFLLHSSTLHQCKLHCVQPGFPDSHHALAALPLVACPLRCAPAKQ